MEIRELGRLMNVSRGIGEDWFTDDLILHGNEDTLSNCPITFWFNSGVNAKINITFDGTNYCDLNDGSNLKFDTLYKFNFYCSGKDIINLKADKAVTIYYCVVGEMEY